MIVYWLGLRTALSDYVRDVKPFRGCIDRNRAPLTGGWNIDDDDDQPAASQTWGKIRTSGVGGGLSPGRDSPGTAPSAFGRERGALCWSTLARSDSLIGDVFYRVATELIELSIQKVCALSVSEALAVVLQTWNKNFYRFNKFSEKHLKDIEELLDSSWLELSAFRRRSIESNHQL
jgi:hypothetical protein